MKTRNTPVSAVGLLIALGFAATLCLSDAKPPEQVADVGPLLDSMATICGEAFEVKHHKLTLDANGNVVGCEVKP